MERDRHMENEQQRERETEEEGEAGEEGVVGALCIMKIENVWVNCKILSDRIQV